MKWIALFLLVCLVPAKAEADSCETEAHVAEIAAGLPTDLLLAIGRVESGRRNQDGRIAPWPWSVNAAGVGHYFASAADAVALVRSLQTQSIRLIDVGCFQMNLFYHPEAFKSLEEAFDPATNAQAAAKFLRNLYESSADWPTAVARYHSADPALGQPYMHQVLQSWHEGPAMLNAPPSQVAALVQVITPRAFADIPAALATSLLPQSVARRSGPRLPVVIVPFASRL